MTDTLIPHGVMLDIETLDTRASSVVLSVAAMRFQLWESGPILLPDMLWTPSLRQQFAAGRTASDTTVKWWGAQPEAAKKHWVNPETEIMPVAKMLAGIKGFCNSDFGPIPVWANGAVFDVGIIESLCAAFGEPIPWEYYVVRDARTIYWDLKQLRHRESNLTWNNAHTTAHHPTHDCITQIWKLWERKPEFDRPAALPSPVAEHVPAAYTQPASEATADTGE